MTKKENHGVMEHIEAAIEQHIVEELLEEDETIDRETRLIQEGILDSIALLRLVAFLEQTFDIRVPENDLVPERFQTIQSIAGYVETLVDSK